MNKVFAYYVDAILLNQIRYSSKCNEKLYTPEKLHVKIFQFMVQSEVSSQATIENGKSDP